MKKIVIVLLVLITVGCSSKNEEKTFVSKDGCDTLNVYNWGEYAASDFISNFEDEYNVKVNYSLFSSNEEMYTSIKNGANYDVIIPTDYIYSLLIEDDLVQKIDHTKLTNLDNIIEGLKTPDFDPNLEYTIPYLWGNVGIIYDKTVVSQEDVEKLGYGIFHEEKYSDVGVVLYDSPLDAFMVALKNLGYSANTTNKDELDEAYEWLDKAAKTMNAQYMQDEIYDPIIYGDIKLSFVYSGVASYIMQENENIAFYAPQEGTVLWTDSLLITKNTECYDLAHTFLDYAIREDVAYNNSEYVGYTSPIQGVVDELTKQGGLYENNSAYMPRLNYDLDEYYTSNLEVKEYITELWMKIKYEN